jgi:hypothetical protein
MVIDGEEAIDADLEGVWSLGVFLGRAASGSGSRTTGGERGGLNERRRKEES